MKILDKSLETAYQLFNHNSTSIQICCFIYSGNRLLSIGQNDMISESPKAIYFGKKFKVEHTSKFPFLHAEIDAISKLWGRHRITGQEKVVVVRYKRAGSTPKLRNTIFPALSKPCNNCNTILNALNLKKVWWTTENGWPTV